MVDYRTNPAYGCSIPSENRPAEACCLKSPLTGTCETVGNGRAPGSSPASLARSAQVERIHVARRPPLRSMISIEVESPRVFSYTIHSPSGIRPETRRLAIEGQLAAPPACGALVQRRTTGGGQIDVDCRLT